MVAVAGLSAPVRVTRDSWGVPHISASNRDDLFFAQGFVQAGDRLFQMDLWRRAAQGRLSEVLGANFIGRDAMTRRIQYRGNLDREWDSYGPEARTIASAFVAGINAWVAIAEERPPESFVLAGWLPERWRSEDLLNRTDAFLASGDAAGEIFRAQLISAIGPGRASALLGEGPVTVPAALDLSAVTYHLADGLRQIGTRPFFTALKGPVRESETSQAAGGSNAWAIDGSATATGAPIVATDPHRLLASPALRYLVHLSAPGWNVIGATAPWLPGVAIGHNDRIAWGMTALAADTMDLSVQRLNPENSHQVEVDGGWQNTTVVTGTVWVKGSARPVSFTREDTPDGVVVGVDRQRNLAFTLRWSGLEPGGASELAALALDRAASIADARSALARWRMPSVEVVLAERAGPIALHRAGAVPTRRGGDGRIPAVGWTGQLQWTGWQSFGEERPSTSTGRFVASANGSRARTERLRAVLMAATPDRPASIDDSAQLQQDVVSSNAERLVPLFERLSSSRRDVEEARQTLLNWDRRIAVGSTPAALYVAFERLARRAMVEPHVPPELVDELVLRSNETFVPAVATASPVWFTGDAPKQRDDLMMRALTAAVDEVTGRRDGAGGRIVFAHPLGITDAARKRFNLGPFERPGYVDTVMSLAGRTPEASIAASFSAIFDLADWDRSVAQLAPGQSESPDSPHFGDLAKLWVAGRRFPLAFSDEALAANTVSTLTLMPAR